MFDCKKTELGGNVVLEQAESKHVELLIIIVNYNTAGYLRDCLSTILEFPPKCDYDIVVVDNASRDNSLDVVKEFEMVRVIANKSNVGFAVANNQAFRSVESEFVLTLNPDSRMTGDTIDSLLNLIRGDESIGIVCPITEEDGREVHTAETFPFIELPAFIKSKFRKNLEFDSQGLSEVRYIWGTGYVCRSRAVGNDELFCEDSFLFGEEFDVCEKIATNGYRVVITKNSRFYHAGSVTFRHDPERLRMATKLNEASMWEKRRRANGRLSAGVCQIVTLAESLVFTLGLSVKRFFKQTNVQRTLSIIKYKSRATASIGLVLRGRDYYIAINQRARKFFNDVPV